MLRNVNEFGKDSAEWGLIRPAQREIEFAIERIQLVVNRFCGGIRTENFVQRADFVLSFFDGFEYSRGEKREDSRAQASDAGTGNEDRAAENVGVNLIEDRVFLRDAAGIDDAFYGAGVFRHAIENDAGMKTGAFDGSTEFVLRAAL